MRKNMTFSPLLRRNKGYIAACMASNSCPLRTISIMRSMYGRSATS